MRCLVSAVFLATALLSPVCDAQEAPSPKHGDRLFVNGGVGRTYSGAWLPGFYLRAEYHFTAPERVVGLRVHVGGFWTPNQSYSAPTVLYGDGTTFQGRAQAMALDVGITGSVTPWPRARLSPYVLGGIAGWEQWTHQGFGYYRRADGSVTGFTPSSGTASYGTFRLVTGVGLQVRLGGRLLQIESRKLAHGQSMLGLGTVLRF